jgi:hypothetical protein
MRKLMNIIVEKYKNYKNPRQWCEPVQWENRFFLLHATVLWFTSLAQIFVIFVFFNNNIFSKPYYQPTVKIWAQSVNVCKSYRRNSIFTTFWGTLLQPALEPHREIFGGRLLWEIFKSDIKLSSCKVSEIFIFWKNHSSCVACISFHGLTLKSVVLELILVGIKWSSGWTRARLPVCKIEKLLRA